jgi:DNA-binding response OmpR family regulator
MSKIQPLRVLIVEDEALLAMELEGIVEDAGHVVAGWATSSTEAKKLVEETEADVAFVDMHLTDGPTGLDVATYIRDCKASMVVFLTANPKRIGDNYAGAVGVIGKPYTVNGLMSALRYIEEGLRRPPPVSERPSGFELSPDYAAQWQ